MIIKRKIILYETNDGVDLVSEWIESLDKRIASRIYGRMKRVEEGNLGDYKRLGDGLCEFRMQFGSGYRVYYFELNRVELVLFCGGIKTRQQKDIARARKYLQDYKRRLL